MEKVAGSQCLIEIKINKYVVARVAKQEILHIKQNGHLDEFICTVFVLVKS